MDDYTKQQLDNLILNDDEGLFDTKKKVSNIISSDDRLVQGFNEINKFYEENDRSPSEFADDVQEKSLYNRLEGLKNNEARRNKLIDYDVYNILSEKGSINSIEDILDDEFFKSDNEEKLFDLKHVKDQKDREESDFVARRKKCKDFEKYEQIFKDCHADLVLGERTYSGFNVGTTMSKGDFYIHRGMLIYIADVGEIKIDKWGKEDGRLNVIFENGTQSNMLMRSLGKVLNTDIGQTITKRKSKLLDEMIPENKRIAEEDKEVGYIYILKSLSENYKIKEIENLYKVGYSSGSVEDRIKNAENEPTYLMASVSIVATYKCFNLNPNKLEHLLHTFFGSACLTLDIYDNENKRHSPREWFSVPLNIIDNAIELVLSEKISNYQYNHEKASIEELEGK